VLAVTAGVLLSAGCGAGFDATSTEPYAPGDGILADSGDLRVINALVVAGDDGRGVVSATVVNRGGRDDTLTGVTSPDATIDVDDSLDLPAGGVITLGGAGEDTESTVVTGLDKEPGETIELKFTFSRTQPVTLRTLVVEATGDYATVTPSPSATPTPTPSSPSPSPSETES
jgi:hypothetical protein